MLPTFSQDLTLQVAFEIAVQISEELKGTEFDRAFCGYFNSIGLVAVLVFLLLQQKTATAGIVLFYAISFKLSLLSLPVFYMLKSSR